MDSDIGATATLVQQQHQTLDGNHHQGQKKQDQVNGTVASAEGHAVDRFRGEVGCSVKEIAVVAPDNDSVGDSSTQCSDVMDDDNEEEETDVEENGAGDWIMNPPVSTIVQQHHAFDTTNGYIALPNPDSSNFSNVRVKDSSNVHLGNEVNYHGPVTIHQVIYTNPTPNQDAIELDVIRPSDNISDLSTNKDNGAPNGCIFPQYTKLNKVTQRLWTWKRAVLSCVITLILLAIVVPITVHFTHQSDVSVSPEIPTSSIEETGNFTTTVEVHPSGEVSPSLNHDSSVTRDDNDLTIQAQKSAQYNNTNNNNNNINYNDNNNNNNNECGIDSYNTNHTDPLFSYGEETMSDQWWLVALFVVRKNYVFKCGGTVLTNRHVITAAHCLKLSVSSNDTVHPGDVVVVLGRFRLRPSPWRELQGSGNREVASFKIHPNYTHEATGDSDLAILTLRTPVEFNHFTKPICLWFGSTNLEDIVNKKGWVVGWGEGEHYGLTVQMARVPIVSQETCVRSHQAFYALTSNRTFCAGLQDNSRVCFFRGGNGLVLFDSTTGRYYLRGIVSRSLLDSSLKCDLSNYVVYVDVAKYTSWIQELISTT